MTVIDRWDSYKKEFKEFKNLEKYKQHALNAYTNRAIKEILVAANKACDYCNNSYYVCGCEPTCQFENKCNKSNNYFYFQLVDTYHDKSIVGV